MAAPASVRLPWRAISRRARSSPISSSNHLLRIDRSLPRRALSNTIENAPETNGAHDISQFSPSPNAGLEGAALSEITSIDQSTPVEPINPRDVRLPRAVQAAYLRPLRVAAKHGLPCCNLQMRSYSVRNLEFYADFCMRAAYYLGLPAYGPIPLPRIVERWTVPKSNFIHKKSQENFERKTLRRMIQIKDGHPEVVEVWLAFVKKHAYYGIGMKANVWSHEKLGVGKTMDDTMKALSAELDAKFSLFGPKKGHTTAEQVMEQVNRDHFLAASGGNAPMMKVHPPTTRSIIGDKRPEQMTADPDLFDDDDKLAEFRRKDPVGVYAKPELVPWQEWRGNESELGEYEWKGGPPREDMLDIVAQIEKIWPVAREVESLEIQIARIEKKWAEDDKAEKEKMGALKQSEDSPKAEESASVQTEPEDLKVEASGKIEEVWNATEPMKVEEPQQAEAEKTEETETTKAEKIDEPAKAAKPETAQAKKVERPAKVAKPEATKAKKVDKPVNAAKPETAKAKKVDEPVKAAETLKPEERVVEEPGKTKDSVKAAGSAKVEDSPKTEESQKAKEPSKGQEEPEKPKE